MCSKWTAPTIASLAATIVKEGGYNGGLLVAATIVEEEMSLAATIADKGAKGAAIDAYKRGMILESKTRELRERM